MSLVPSITEAAGETQTLTESNQFSSPDFVDTRTAICYSYINTTTIVLNKTVYLNNLRL